MDLKVISDIKELLVPVATSVTLLSVAISSWLALRQYRLKLKSEKIENDIKLVKAFCDLLNIAHARSQTIYVESYLDKLFEREIITKADFHGLNLDKKIQSGAVILPIGAAAQDAAIAAVATLGLRHDVLHEASIQALSSLVDAVPDKKNIISTHLEAARASALGYRVHGLKRWLRRSN
jgi:hypothetical protein